MRRRGLPSGREGQAVVIIAFMLAVLLSGAGLAIDATAGYYYNTAAEKAAAAAALSGVVFMPYSFTPAQAVPAGSGNDATDRALAESSKNGFTNGAGSVSVTVSQVAGFSNRLDVIVRRQVPTIFMLIFGVTSYVVAHESIATYLPPLSLGQPGAQIGSTVAQLDTNPFFMRTEGWSTPRSQGDAFTPNPSGCAVACPTTDVHLLSGGADNADPALPSRGGYNFRVVVPSGVTARIQAYNASFAPDGGNRCDNWDPAKINTATQCSNHAPTPYNLHEDDSFPALNTFDAYSTMEYSVFRMVNHFNRNLDQKLTQVKVKPINAHNYTAPSNQYQYYDVPSSSWKNITQTFNPVTGAPTNMNIYHSWIDVMNYGEPAPNAGMVSMSPAGGYGGAALSAGEYRVRMDTLEYNGTNPPGNSQAHKATSFRVLDASTGLPCVLCSLAAMSDMSIFTPVQASAGNNFRLSIFQLPPDYAGKTINVDIFDPGDLNAGPGGALYLGLIDPRTSNLLNVAPSIVPIYNLQQSKSNCCGPPSTSFGTPTIAETPTPVTDPGGQYFNGYWLHFQVPIPGSYNPGNNPNNWWFQIQYRTTGTVNAADTFTIAISLQGAPAHLLQ